MKRIIIYSLFLLNWFSLIGQSDFLSLKKLRKERQYLVDSFDYESRGREIVEILIDRHVFHPEVKRLVIKDYREDTTLFPIENFPNIQELLIKCQGRTDVPLFVTKFKKIQFLSIRYSGSDNEEMIYCALVRIICSAVSFTVATFY